MGNSRRLTGMTAGCALAMLLAAAGWRAGVHAQAGGDVIQAPDGSGDTLVVRARGRDGTVRLAVAGGTGPQVPAQGDTSVAARAQGFARLYGAALGMAPGSDARVVAESPSDRRGVVLVRMQQEIRGIPVTGGALNVHLRGDRVVKVSAEVLPTPPDTFAPALDAARAAALAQAAVERRTRGAAASITVRAPRLEILNTGLLDDRPATTRLAWFVEVRGPRQRDYMWFDARSGVRVLAFSQTPHARDRRTHNANGDEILPGTLVRSENDPATGDPDADAAHDGAGEFYDYLLSRFGRDSYDGAGAPLVQTVNYCNGPCPYFNAFWDGERAVYGEGYPLADDIVAHELTHALTESTAHLFYYAQSGALNESLSDAIGETVDIGNGRGDDGAAVRWLVGEDLPGGPLRHMMSPGAYNDPADTQDPHYVCDPHTDGGGVHYNSGVPNHAFALLADGGAHGGVTVTGIGVEKAARIHFRALTAYHTSGSNFTDHAVYLAEACGDLVGEDGITAADCAEVVNATQAVKMHEVTWCGVANAPALCPLGQVQVDIDRNGFDGDTVEGFAPQIVSGGLQGWRTDTSSDWSVQGRAAVGDDLDQVSDSALAMTSGATLPEDARVQIRHAWAFDWDGGFFFDGGVIEYSTDGSTWQDAIGLFSQGEGYAGTLEPGYGNPIEGRQAFVHSSLGFTATQLDLAPLAGQPLRLRFRIGTDGFLGDLGWYIDDVFFYSCAPQTAGSFGGGATAERAVVRQGGTGALSWLVDGRAPVTLGVAGDMPVPADYDGDGDTDPATFSSGTWRIGGSTIPFGEAGDIPAPADYDGDGAADLAVFRPSTGQWLIEGESARAIGAAGDIPVAADYTGDGRADPAVFRPSTAQWLVWQRFTVTVTVLGQPGDLPVPADFTGDGIVEMAVFRPSTGTWYVAGTSPLTFGAPGDIPVPLNLAGNARSELVVFRPATGHWFAYDLGTGTSSSGAYGSPGDLPAMLRPYLLPRTLFDADGDRRTDPTVWRPGNGAWYRLGSGPGYTPMPVLTWGVSTDVAVPGDYDGDGRLDAAVYRPSNSTWYIRFSATGAVMTRTFGVSTDVAVTADFDGDRRSDIAVFRPSNGRWFTLSSTTGFSSGLNRAFGIDGDLPRPADLDADGRADLVVFRPSAGAWYAAYSGSGFAGTLIRRFGNSSDQPVVADLDGDRRSELIVFRPSNGGWYWLTSASGFSSASAVLWGTAADVPVAADYTGDGASDLAVWRPASGAWYVRGGPTLTWGTSTDVPIPRAP